MAAAVAEIERFGGLDVVVANAGASASRRHHPRDVGRGADRVLDVNLNGVHRTVIAALPDRPPARARRRRRPVYAFVNGSAPFYAMSKCGVVFGRALRVELAQHGAGASVAYFGFIDTAMVQHRYGPVRRLGSWNPCRGRCAAFQPAAQAADRRRHREARPADHPPAALGDSLRPARRAQPGPGYLHDRDAGLQDIAREPTHAAARSSRRRRSRRYRFAGRAPRRPVHRHRCRPRLVPPRTTSVPSSTSSGRRAGRRSSSGSPPEQLAMREETLELSWPGEGARRGVTAVAEPPAAGQGPQVVGLGGRQRPGHPAARGGAVEQLAGVADAAATEPVEQQSGLAEQRRGDVERHPGVGGGERQRPARRQRDVGPLVVLAGSPGG